MSGLRIGIMRRFVLALLAVPLCLGVLWGPNAVDATRLGLDLARGSELDADSIASREAVRCTVDDRTIDADLYQPRGRVATGAMVLLAGADRVGKDHPRFVAFASALADAGYTVLVPDLVDLRTLRIRRGEETVVADANLWLAERTGLPVALAGISFAVGPAVLAALDPRIRERVPFVLGIGGFYDLGRVVAGLHNPYGKWLFAAANIDAIDDPADRSSLAAMAARRLADPNADLADLAQGLRPEGRAVYALIANADPAQADALIAALPARLRTEIAAVSLKGRDLSALHARLVLVHGNDDPLIPAAESVALAAAAGDKAELHLIDRMRHVELGGGWADLVRLWWVCWRVVELR